MPLFGPPNIGKLKSKRDIEGLIKALDYRKNPQIRQAAAEALITIALHITNNAAGWKHTYGRAGEWEAAVQMLHRVTLRITTDISLDEMVREAAVQTLVAVFLGKPYGLVPAVAEAVSQTLVLVGQPAVRPLITTLNELQTHRKVSGFFDHFTRDEENEQIIIQTLVNLGELSLDPLITALQEKKSISGYAARILGRIGHPRAVEPLIAVLADEDWFGRGAAAEALGRIGNPRAMDALIAVGGTDPYVRHSVVEAMLRLRGSHPAAFGPASAMAGVGAGWYLNATAAAAEELTKLGDKNVAEGTVWSLQGILKYHAAEIEPQMLRQITCVGEVQQMRLKGGDGFGGAVYLPEPVDCSYMKLLAWQELIRRGLA